ncbi:hypothetical protein ABPG72_009968 [Tetrahymena utriculariae]
MRQSILIVILALLAIGVIAKNTTFEREVSHGRHNATELDLLKIFSSYGYFANPSSERFKLFKERLIDIIKHNLNPHKTYTQKINKFTFYTQEELSQLNAAQNCSATAKENMAPKKQYNLKDIPQFVDWRTKGVVTPVKDQGRAFNNFGCNGGLPSQAFEYIAFAGGLDTEGDYPYEATDNTCEFIASHSAAKVVRSFNITFQDEDELIYHLATAGPVSIAYQVTDDFFKYDGGIYSNPYCSTSPDEVNHAVLAVGYNLTGRYYIVKNSWGEHWGNDGYFNIELGSNMCGLADCASYPIVQGHHQY